MVRYYAGDDVFIKIADSTAVGAESKDFDVKDIFQVIGISPRSEYYSEYYLIYVPQSKYYLKNAIQVSDYNLKSLALPKKYVGDYVLDISDYYIAGLHRRMEGEACITCKEFVYMASRGAEAVFTCRPCRINPWNIRS